MKYTKLKEGTYLTENNNNFRIIHPYKKEPEQPFSSDNINWKNILLGGSWGNILKIILVIGFILFISWSYRHDINECVELIENKQEICSNYYNNLNSENIGGVLPDNELNISLFLQSIR